MAQSRDRIGRFAGSGGVSYGNRSDRDSDIRSAKRQTGKLNRESRALQARVSRLEAKAPSARVSSARAKKAKATKKLSASRSRMAELKVQLAASQARLGGKSATKRGARI
jgi:valyl-tRNA synthetase